MGNTATLQKSVCEECGLPESEWKGNHGRGVREREGRACCVECAGGLGCNCKETGVRRVVIVKNSEENKNTYVKKMDRQMKDWQAKIKNIEQNASSRGAMRNPSVSGKLSELKKAQSASKSRIDSVKSSGGDWAQKARGASSDYRRMKAAAADLGSRVKKK